MIAEIKMELKAPKADLSAIRYFGREGQYKRLAVNAIYPDINSIQNDWKLRQFLSGVSIILMELYLLLKMYK